MNFITTLRSNPGKASRNTFRDFIRFCHYLWLAIHLMFISFIFPFLCSRSALCILLLKIRTDLDTWMCHYLYHIIFKSGILFFWVICKCHRNSVIVWIFYNPFQGKEFAQNSRERTFILKEDIETVCHRVYLFICNAVRVWVFPVSWTCTSNKEERFRVKTFHNERKSLLRRSHAVLPSHIQN